MVHLVYIGKVVHEYNVITPIKGQSTVKKVLRPSRDSPWTVHLIYSGKLVHEYNVTIDI